MCKEQELVPANKYFYEEAINFYQSGMIISNSNERICEDYDLFSPIIYLFRHSIELLLKALIIECLLEKNVINWSELKLSPHNRKLSSMHSVVALLDTFKEQLKSVKYEISSELIEMEAILEELDELDFSSTFFRYPFDKEGKRNQKLLTEDVTDLLMHMPCSLGNLIYHEGVDKFSCLHREQMIDSLDESLIAVIEELIKLYNDKGASDFK